MVGIKCVIGLFSNPRQGLSNAAQTLKNLNITEFIFLFLLIFFSQINFVFAYLLEGLIFECSVIGIEFC